VFRTPSCFIYYFVLSSIPKPPTISAKMSSHTDHTVAHRVSMRRTEMEARHVHPRHLVMKSRTNMAGTAGVISFRASKLRLMNCVVVLSMGAWREWLGSKDMSHRTHLLGRWLSASILSTVLLTLSLLFFINQLFSSYQISPLVGCVSILALSSSWVFVCVYW